LIYKEKERAGRKPGSVVDNHSSGTAVADCIVQPTREPVQARCGRNPPTYSPIWSCSGWGLPCRGVLPPARCALTAPFHPYRHKRAGGIFSVALSMGSHPPGVTWRLAWRSPDFPPGFSKETRRLPGRLSLSNPARLRG